jgi:hypothetical protein
LKEGLRESQRRRQLLKKRPPKKQRRRQLLRLKPRDNTKIKCAAIGLLRRPLPAEASKQAAKDAAAEARLQRNWRMRLKRCRIAEEKAAVEAEAARQYEIKRAAKRKAKRIAERKLQRKPGRCKDQEAKENSVMKKPPVLAEIKAEDKQVVIDAQPQEGRRGQAKLQTRRSGTTITNAPAYDSKESRRLDRGYRRMKWHQSTLKSPTNDATQLKTNVAGADRSAIVEKAALTTYDRFRFRGNSADLQPVAKH